MAQWKHTDTRSLYCLSQLGEDLSKEKYVVLNNDDSFSEYLRTVTPYEVFSYRIDEEAQFMAKNIQESLQGVSFDFVTPFGTYPSKIALCLVSLIFLILWRQ